MSHANETFLIPSQPKIHLLLLLLHIKLNETKRKNKKTKSFRLLQSCNTYKIFKLLLFSNIYIYLPFYTWTAFVVV